MAAVSAVATGGSFKYPAQNCVATRQGGLYVFTMNAMLMGLEYLLAALAGLVIAIFPVGLLSYAILPPDGPIGEGFIILLMYLISCCACIPGFVALMALHREGRRSTRKLIACEVLLRISVFIAACFICFMAIRLPTAVMTKWIACFAAIPAGGWAINPASWNQSRK